MYSLILLTPIELELNHSLDNYVKIFVLPHSSKTQSLQSCKTFTFYTGIKQDLI